MAFEDPPTPQTSLVLVFAALVGFFVRFVRSYRFTASLVCVGLAAYLIISAQRGSWGTYDAVWDFWAAMSLAVLHLLLLNAGRLASWESRMTKRGVARSQERRAQEALAHCFICGSADQAWAYPLKREAPGPEGTVLLPPWLATCEPCHLDIESLRMEVLQHKLAQAYANPRDRAMRQILPLFLAARDGEARPHTANTWPREVGR